MSTVYLIHFDKKYHHAGHYIGVTTNLKARMRRHFSNNGARLIQVVNAAGIPWNVVRTWEGGRELEKRLKKRKEAPQLCPVCNPTGYMKLAQEK